MILLYIGVAVVYLAIGMLLVHLMTRNEERDDIDGPGFEAIAIFMWPVFIMLGAVVLVIFGPWLLLEWLRKPGGASGE